MSTSTATALATAGRDIRSGWTLRTTLTVLAIAAALIAPSVLPLSGRMPDLAAFVYTAVAAVGLAYAVGLAGIPSLGQGAFLGVGAFTEAIARAKGGWPLLPSLLLAVVAATAAGGLPDSLRAGCEAPSSPPARGSSAGSSCSP